MGANEVAPHAPCIVRVPFSQQMAVMKLFSPVFRQTFIPVTEKLIYCRQGVFTDLKLWCQKSTRSFSSCQESEDMSKIGINGFGRIGRLVLRASLERGGQVCTNFTVS